MGATFGQLEMSAWAALIKAHQKGASLTVPIVQAIYAGRKEKARKLSAEAQSFSAKLFADFLLSVHSLFKNGEHPGKFAVDLRDYPCGDCKTDMLYRYQALKDISLVPLSGGKTVPLTLRMRKNGQLRDEKVKGLGVIAYLGPENPADPVREAFVEYNIFPGACKTFRAMAGLSPLFKESVIPVIFKVLGDGRTLYESPVIRQDDEAVKIELSLGKIRKLRLVMTYTRSPENSEFKKWPRCEWAPHGVWAFPELI
jgi:hypothetical protein